MVLCLESVIWSVQARAALQAAGNMAGVTEAQKQVESLSWEGGYCPFSQPLQALNATALLRLHRSGLRCESGLGPAKQSPLYSRMCMTLHCLAHVRQTQIARP